jgi:uncharacterized protein
MMKSQDQSDFATQWESWHREHEARRARPHGFLAITSIHWLHLESQRFDDVPGAWSSDGDGVSVRLDDNEYLAVGDVGIIGDHHFQDVNELGIQATFGDALVEISRRNDHFMIRPRHPEHAPRTRYSGTPAYPASVDWVVEGTLIPSPQSVTVDATVEGLAHVYQSPGEVEFHIAGQAQRLVAFNGDDADELDFVFTDATSGSTSYAACRFLTVPAPGPDRLVTMDFNRATNPPCAYTDFATCPLPPPGNHLTVSIEAGEMSPHNSP